MWIVLADCGDYYCEHEHPVAVTTTEHEALRIAEMASKEHFPTHPTIMVYDQVWVQEIQDGERIKADKPN